MESVKHKVKMKILTFFLCETSDIILKNTLGGFTILSASVIISKNNTLPLQ